MGAPEIEKGMVAMKKATAKKTPHERAKYVAQKSASLASTIAKANKLLADLACLGATRTLELVNSAQLKRVRVFHDPKVRALPVDLRLPKFKLVQDITDYPKPKK